VAIVIAEDNWIGVEGFGIEHKNKQDVGKNGLSSFNEAGRIAERNLVWKALSHYRSNDSRAAREPGVSRPALYTLMKKHNPYM
jgi:DNA-binding NtrC family response regulator